MKKSIVFSNSSVDKIIDSSSSSEDNQSYTPKLYAPFKLVFARKYKHNMWPAAILGPAGLKNGYRVYFFRSKDVLDLSKENIFKDFSRMLNMEVSFRANHSFRKGIITDITINESQTVPFFLIENKNQLYKVSFFNVYMKAAQIKAILSRNTRWRITCSFTSSREKMTYELASS